MPTALNRKEWTMRCPIPDVSAIASLALPALLLAASVSQAAESESGWRSVAYVCESGQSLTVSYRDSGSAVQVAEADAKAVKLVARPASSGSRYSDSRHQLLVEGDSVSWQTGKRAPVKCVASGTPSATTASVPTR